MSEYHYRYGYPWWWAILAEFFWRVEHSRFFPRWGYRMRKACERKGVAA